MSRSNRAPRWAGWLVATLAVIASVGASAAASAQSVTVKAPSGPHYLGDPIQIQVVADGFEADPTPTIEVQGARAGLVYRGVAPSVNSSITIINGQIRRTKDVKFVFTYALRVDRPGPVAVGPFVVTQGTTRKTARRVRFDLRDVPATERVHVELEFSDAPVYIGARVPITLRFRLVGEVRKNLHRYTLRVPLFDQTDTFRFLDPPDVGETDIKIQTASGELNLKADATETTIDGEKALEISIRRIAVPLRDGVLNIPATILDVEEGTRYRRDLFGGRQATHVRKWRATDAARRFVVKRIPGDRTPASFAGAVGTGFSLRVTADRTVVQLGEPIALTFELRGDGNLEAASLPPLNAKGLLPAAQFRVPEGELAGRLDDSAKKFTAMVRVTDRAVTEIPALEYSWFDPTNETFVSTRSRPIALSVRDAQRIGAAQVERELPSGEMGDASSQAGAGSGASPSTTLSTTEGATLRGGLALTGADLAIERDPARLVRVARSESVGIWGIVGLYLGTALLFGAAKLDRKRRDVDPQVAARRRRIAEQLRLVRAAGSLPAAESAGAIASALRAMVAEVPQADTAEINAFVGECDAHSYAPSSERSPAPLDPAFHARAQQLARQIEQQIEQQIAEPSS